MCIVFTLICIRWVRANLDRFELLYGVMFAGQASSPGRGHLCCMYVSQVFAREGASVPASRCLCLLCLHCAATAPTRRFHAVTSTPSRATLKCAVRLMLHGGSHLFHFLSVQYLSFTPYTLKTHPLLHFRLMNHRRCSAFVRILH